jgi:hypothetical protein
MLSGNTQKAPAALQMPMGSDATAQPQSCPCREAVAKLNANRDDILRDCASRSGVFTDSTGVNGKWMRPLISGHAQPNSCVL